MKRLLIGIAILCAWGKAARADEMRLAALYQPYEFAVSKAESRCAGWHQSYGMQFAWDSDGAAGMIAESTYSVINFEPALSFNTLITRRSQWLTTLGATALFRLGPVTAGFIYGGGLLYEKYGYGDVAVKKYFPAGLLGAEVLVHLGPHVYVACEPRFVPVLGDQPLSFIAEGMPEPATYDGHDMAFGVAAAAGYVF
jgi:hypothetical protein